MARILVVDDQPNMRSTLKMMLSGAGYAVEEAGDGAIAIERIGAESFDVVLTDMKMGQPGGLEVLRLAKQQTPLTEVMVMTAYGTIETAVEAMRLGAHDYLQKPFSEEELLVKVERALEKRKLVGEVSVMAAEFRDRYGFENIIGRSQAIRDVLSKILRISPTDATALITGESGTGKELVARAIHSNSQRSAKPFVGVNCAAISETLLESELFGHVRGAFTGAVSTRKGLFEEADGGTFFFDEIAETPPSFQAKLLRAIQEGEIRRVGDNAPVSVDVRIIAAANQDLKKAIEEKRFREDLFYRLNVARFELPPLRKRPEDIPLLCDHFLGKYGEKMRRSVRLGDGVIDQLSRYPFPGNIRELENLMEQGVALSLDGILRLDDVLTPEMRQEMGQGAAPSESAAQGESLQEAIDKTEREYIRRTLEEVDGNKERAAEVLGLSPTTLWRKMKRLQLNGP